MYVCISLVPAATTGTFIMVVPFVLLNAIEILRGNIHTPRLIDYRSIVTYTAAGIHTYI